MKKLNVLWCLMVLAAGLLPGTMLGAGFALFEHGARGVAMAGAFGAIADDPTAGYYNPAGLAFQSGTHAAIGAYFIQVDSKVQGADPYPGSNYQAEQEAQIFYPPHAYVDGNLTANTRWGIAVTTPFGLGTWWPDDFAGRYITKRTDLKVFNVNPNFATRMGDDLAFAVGADLYVSNVDLTKSIGLVNPYTQTIAEVGQAHISTKQQTGWGWNAAMLAKLQGGFSVGLTYRSSVKIDMDGTASFTQFPTGHADFDAIVASVIPFGSKPDAKTNIEFPSESRIALAWQGQRWTVEADVVRMGWHSFKELPITIVGYPQLSSVRAENYKDSNSYRLGFEWKKSDKLAFEFGYLYDQSPVPTETVSPILPDADRTGLSAGFSWSLSASTRLDVGYLHLMFKDRSTEGLDADNFNGTYSNQGELLGFTLVFRF
jgi:long-chain fatty acid transport protein